MKITDKFEKKVLVGVIVLCLLSIIVKSAASMPFAEFSASPTSGPVPLTVSFSDLSTGNPTSWAWDFGDGSASSEQNPVHVYNVDGFYTVILTAANSDGEDTATRANLINVQSTATTTTITTTISTSTTIPLIAIGFEASPKTGNTPLTV